MQGHAQGMFMGNVRECIAMHRECSRGMSGNAWPCTRNVEGDLFSHAQGIFNWNVRECMVMHRESKSTDNCSTRMLHSPDLQSSRFILSGWISRSFMWTPPCRSRVGRYVFLIAPGKIKNKVRFYICKSFVVVCLVLLSSLHCRMPSWMWVRYN